MLKKYQPFIVLLFAFYFAQGQDYLYPIEFPIALEGEIVVYTGPENPNFKKVKFIEKGRSDTVIYDVTEVKWFRKDTVSYIKVYLPPHIDVQGEVFAQELYNGCVSLYKVPLYNNVNYLAKKTQNNYVAFESFNYLLTAKRFFKEDRKTVLKFASGGFPLDSMLLAIKDHNAWMVNNNIPCNYTRTSGFVRWWERLSGEFSLGGGLGFVTNDDFLGVYNKTWQSDLSLKIDVFNHSFSILYKVQVGNYSKRNNIGTLNKLYTQGQALGVRLNKLVYKNPFNRVYLFGFYHLNDYRFKAQPIDCSAPYMRYGKGEGTQWSFGIGKSKNWSYWEMIYQSHFLIQPNYSESYTTVGDLGIDTGLPNGDIRFGELVVKFGVNISMVPWIRQYKQF